MAENGDWPTGYFDGCALFGGQNQKLMFV